MKLFDKLFGKKESIDYNTSFMEHPTGEFSNAAEAIISTMKRLSKLDMGDRWLEFCSQGQGNASDQIHMESVLFNGKTFDLKGQTIDVDPIANSIGVSPKIDSGGKITLPDATPKQLGLFLDAIFTKHFGITPFEDDNDYSVGAEW